MMQWNPSLRRLASHIEALTSDSTALLGQIFGSLLLLWETCMGLWNPEFGLAYPRIVGVILGANQWMADVAVSDTLCPK